MKIDYSHIKRSSMYLCERTGKICASITQETINVELTDVNDLLYEKSIARGQSRYEDWIYLNNLARHALWIINNSLGRGGRLAHLNVGVADIPRRELFVGFHEWYDAFDAVKHEGKTRKFLGIENKRYLEPIHNRCNSAIERWLRYPVEENFQRVQRYSEEKKMKADMIVLIKSIVGFFRTSA